MGESKKTLSVVERMKQQQAADAEERTNAPKIKILEFKEQLREVKAATGITDWVKWEEIGQTVEGVLVSWEKDVRGNFGKNDLLQLRADEETIYGIRCPKRLQALLRQFEQLITVGQSKLIITYTGTAPVAGNLNPAKLFDVGIEQSPLEVEFEKIVEGK